VGMRALAAMGDDPDKGWRHIQPSDASSDLVTFSLHCDRHRQAHAVGAVNRCGALDRGRLAEYLRWDVFL
jgi:hypothetical protein